MGDLFRPLLASARPVDVLGPAYFAGLAPDPEDATSIDGRYRILNEPARGRILVYERGRPAPVAETHSSPVGEWMVGSLRPDRYYTVIGFDDRGLQNAAVQDWVKPHVPE